MVIGWQGQSPDRALKRVLDAADVQIGRSAAAAAAVVVASHDPRRVPRAPELLMSPQLPKSSGGRGSGRLSALGPSGSVSISTTLRTTWTGYSTCFRGTDWP